MQSDIGLPQNTPFGIPQTPGPKHHLGYANYLRRGSCNFVLNAHALIRPLKSEKIIVKNILKEMFPPQTRMQS
jgi:hypothetical protein